ncbi:unnamed protein product [Cyprideis torosa]|uniref:Uncharacterized protein n=1 Tax=Cyprideis torosa TaxID=163714 RepID=A0A7R8W1B3_9CRUS|nr:unnamed protein product [Cyprideis torosa]CAG0879630.1 unnamed protein product [Cyprideis torosa]
MGLRTELPPSTHANCHPSPPQEGQTRTRNPFALPSTQRLWKTLGDRIVFRKRDALETVGLEQPTDCRQQKQTPTQAWPGPVVMTTGQQRRDADGGAKVAAGAVASLFLWSLVSAHVASDRQGRAPQSELESVVKDILTRPSATEEPESTRHPICGVEYDCVDPGDCDQYGNIFSSDLLDRTKLLKVPKQMPGSGFFHGGLLDNPREVRLVNWDGFALAMIKNNITEDLLSIHGYFYNRVSICCPGAPNAENFPPVPQTCGVRNFNGVNPVDSFNDPLLLIDEKNFKASVTHFGEFPWQAMIFFEKGPLSYNFLCGGVLISTRHVLTAAHNVNGYDVKKLHVRLGEWKVNEDKEALPVQDFLVESVVQHPLFRIRDRYAVRERWPADRGRYCNFTLSKCNIDTNSALANLARYLRINVKYLNFAGMKDKRAVTSQRVSASYITAERIIAAGRVLIPNVRLGDYVYDNVGIRPGLHTGNHFKIAISFIFC